MDFTATHALAATASDALAPDTASSAKAEALHFRSESDAVFKPNELAVNQWSSSFGQSFGGIMNYAWLSVESTQSQVLSSSSDRLSFYRATPLGFSGTDTTNVQTSGINEADNAEFSSDGFAFVFRDQVIRIIDINDIKNLKEVSRIELPGMTATMHS